MAGTYKFLLLDPRTTRTRFFTVFLEIKHDRIAEYLARRAIRSKSRKSSAMHGMVKVKIGETDD